jgi:hypothetical protein
MRAMPRALPGLVLCAALFGACSPRTAGVLLDTGATPAGLLQRMVAAKGEKLHTLQGSGAVSFDTPELSGDAAFTSRLRRPDSLLVTLEGPFGIDLGTLFLSRDTYLVYNSMENRVVTGNPSTGSFRSILPFEMTFEQILNAFAGIFLLPDQEPAAYEVRDGLFFLSFPCGTSSCEYWVDPELLIVVRFRRLDAGGEVIMEARCTSPAEQDDATAPRKIVVTFPGEQRRLSIAYSRVTLNAPDVSFDYSIPSNARTTVR